MLSVSKGLLGLEFIRLADVSGSKIPAGTEVLGNDEGSPCQPRSGEFKNMLPNVISTLVDSGNFYFLPG
jgi:hypothetical protein